MDRIELSRMTAASVAQPMRQGQSMNTRASYASAMRYWAAWYSARYGRPLQLPVPIQVVIQFITDHAERPVEFGPEQTAKLMRTSKARQHSAIGHATGPETTFDLPPKIDALLVAERYKGKSGPLAFNTLLHRLPVLSKAHQLCDLDNPCNHSGVRELMQTLRRGHADRGVSNPKLTALTREPLQAVLNTCDDSPRGIRDRALLLFAWASGGRRRSEVTSATMDNLKNLGADGFVYILVRSKGNQEGKEDPSSQKPVSGKAALALREWLAVGGITEGPIFRRVLKGGKVAGEPLDPESVRKMVQRRCRLAGLPGHFSAHSLRSGYVTEAGRCGTPIADVMRLTGHLKTETFLSYFQFDSVPKGNAGRLLEGDK